jgi:hypothetical protein
MGNATAGRRKAKGMNGLNGIYGRAIPMLTAGKEGEVESDLGEIRRGTKRRRQATIPR